MGTRAAAPRTQGNREPHPRAGVRTSPWLVPPHMLAHTHRRHDPTASTLLRILAILPALIHRLASRRHRHRSPVSLPPHMCMFLYPSSNCALARRERPPPTEGCSAGARHPPREGAPPMPAHASRARWALRWSSALDHSRSSLRMSKKEGVSSTMSSRSVSPAWYGLSPSALRCLLLFDHW